jgi:hypothetical protein
LLPQHGLWRDIRGNSLSEHGFLVISGLVMLGRFSVVQRCWDGVFLAGFAASAHPPGSGSATLDAVKVRGQLACGVAGTTEGFSLPETRA